MLALSSTPKVQSEVVMAKVVYSFYLNDSKFWDESWWKRQRRISRRISMGFRSENVQMHTTFQFQISMGRYRLDTCSCNGVGLSSLWCFLPGPSSHHTSQ